MDLGSIFLILALAILVGLYITRPFFTKVAAEKVVSNRVSDLEREHRRSALLAEHDRVLNALQELEFDHTLGKIPEEDYPAQRSMLLVHGAETLRQLDEFQPQNNRTSAEDRIEAAVAARRADGSRKAVNGPASDTHDELENLIAARRRQRQEKSVGFCPKCGKPIQKSDRFCSGCGTTIS